MCQFSMFFQYFRKCLVFLLKFLPFILYLSFCFCLFLYYIFIYFSAVNPAHGKLIYSTLPANVFSPYVQVYLIPFSPTSDLPGVRIWFEQEVRQPVRGVALHAQSHLDQPEPQISADPEQRGEDQRAEQQGCRWSGRHWVNWGKWSQTGSMGNHPAGAEPLPRVPGVPSLTGLGYYVWQGKWGRPWSLCMCVCV